MKRTLLAAISIAAVALPFAASAQPWGGGDFQRQSGYGYRQTFSGYPQFRGEKAHIRAEIRQGLDEGWLDRDQASDMYRQLQWVQRRETSEFRAHGWSLPRWDQQQIQSSLDRIDQSIDEARDSGGDNGDNEVDR